MKKFLLTAVCLLLLTGCAPEDALYYLPEEEETAPAGNDAFTPLPHQLGAAPFEYTETGDRPAANPGNAGRQSMFKYSDEYLYFCSKEPWSGELYFSRTLEEHEMVVNTYRPLWQEWDRQQGL